MKAAEMLAERLDTGFYSRAFFDVRAAIARSGLRTESIGSVCDPWQFGAYALCNDIVWTDSENGVPYIKAEALGAPLLNESGLSFITHGTHELLEKSRVKAGDIVVSTSGTVGLCAVVPSHITKANSNQDTIKFDPSSAAYDSYFVAAWISSSVGQVFLSREAGGAVQQHIYLYNFRRIPLLKIEGRAQQYIGDKVRQAERLRNRARTLTCVATQLVESLLERRITETEIVTAYDTSERLHVSTATSTQRSSANDEASAGLIREVEVNSRARAGGATWASTDSLTEERLDASYYSERFLRNEAFLRSCGVPMVAIKTLTVKCNCGATPVDVSYDSSGIGLIRTTDVRPNTFLRDTVLRTNELNVSASSEVAAVSDDLVYTISGTIGYAAVIPPTQEVFSFSNTIVRARFSKESGQDPYFTAVFFNCKYGYMQSLRLVSGGIQGHVMPNPFKRLLVPTPDSRAQRYIGNTLRIAETCTSTARALTSTAKQLVEALISGTLTEIDLRDAQTALKSNNRGPDRAILESLRRDDDPNTPLIPDVDALYELLDEIAREGSDE